MLARRIIPCLDVKDGMVVKGVGFRHHQVMGDILELAKYYTDSGADELVFYDITASAEARTVSVEWVEQVARRISIPFCVAGGIRSVASARAILYAGADKISINTPALMNPDLIGAIAAEFGVQCVVVGVDSYQDDSGEYRVWKATGSAKTAAPTNRLTMAWLNELEGYGAGEVVLNCMNSDGKRQGYDLAQLQAARAHTQLPLIASGGAGSSADFARLFQAVAVDGALAASIFHSKACEISALKSELAGLGIPIRT